MPSKGVNSPTDIKEREKDINQKLHLYGIYSAFNKGKHPSNEQIDIALNSLLACEALTSPSTRLSPEGQKIVQDLRYVIYDAKQLILVKNEGNLIQEFLWEARQPGETDVEAPGAPVDQETAKQDGTQALEGLKTLGTLVVTNGQFRKLLGDATILFRDMIADTAEKAAVRIRPPEDQLAQVDQPAEENVWHETPELLKGKAKAAVKSQLDKLRRGDQGAAEGQTEGEGDVSGEAKERQLDLAKRAKAFLAEKMPQERREQTIWRLKKMLIEIQGRSDYQQSVETLLSLAERYIGYGKDVSQQGVGGLKGVADEQRKELDIFKTLIERFANSTSTDDLLESVNNIYRDADNDSQLKDWFKSVDSFIRKCIREEGYILEDSTADDWHKLYDEGRFLLRERYRDHVNRIVDEIKFLSDQFDQDPLNKAFVNSLQKLFRDLGQDEDGNIVFKKQLWDDVTSVILPAIFENVRYIPIPRIEISDPTLDAFVENLVVESDNLVPNVLELESNNYWRWGRKKISNRTEKKIMVAATGIQTDWRDVSYYVKRKSGFPAITDMGMMDVFMGGEGFSFRITGSAAQKKDHQHFIRPDKISVSVRNLKVNIKKTRHRFLFTLFKPLMFRAARPALEKALEKQIRDSFVNLDKVAYDIHKEAQHSQEVAREDSENKESTYTFYLDAVRKQLLEKNGKVEKTNRGTVINFAFTEEDALFKDVKLPDGILMKATEFKQLAAQGDKWQSPVFTIGSAAPSTGLPSLAPITRKHRGTAPEAGGSGEPGQA